MTELAVGVGTLGTFSKNQEKKLEEANSLIWFYGISTIVGYLMPNNFYKYILNI